MKTLKMKTRQNSALLRLLALVLATLAVYVTPLRAQDQDNGPSLEQMLANDTVTVNALVMYPDTTRRAVLEAAQYPDVLVQMKTLRDSMQRRFNALVAPYSQKQQEAMWNLTRYPDLLEKITAGGKKKRSVLKALAKPYPEDVYDDAVKYGRKRYDVLTQITALNKESNAAFEAFISRQPESAQRSFRRLLQEPEALNTITDNLTLTKRLGRMYRANPSRLIAKADSMHAVAVQRHGKEVQDWKTTLANDAQTRAEFEQAARDYADQYWFARGVEMRRLQRMYAMGYYGGYAVRPYSYWFGYPAWYPADYWYPYPYWNDLGFYYGPGGELIVMDYPSPYFTYWYYSDPMNVYYYPNLCNGFVQQYYGHRGYTTAGNVPVENWVQQNRSNFSQSFARDKDVRLRDIQRYAATQRDRAVAGQQSPDNGTAAKRGGLTRGEANGKMVTREPGSLKSQTQASRRMPSPVTENRAATEQAPRIDQNRDASQYHQRLWEQSNPQPALKDRIPQQQGKLGRRP